MVIRSKCKEYEETSELLAQALPLWKQVQVDLADRFEPQKWQTLLSLLSDITVLDR